MLGALVVPCIPVPQVLLLELITGPGELPGAFANAMTHFGQDNPVKAGLHF